MNRIQLLRFIQSPHPILHNFTLERVRGLRNSDFRDFLTIVSSTLTHLTIWACPMTREPDEEYALDVVMPILSTIESLTIYGDNLSTFAIARKSPSNPRCGISIDNAPGLKLGFLPEALKSGSWESVRITWRTALTEEEEAFRRQAADIARAKNIVFRCSLPPIYVPYPSE